MSNTIEQVQKFFEENTDKSYRAWEIAKNLWLEKEEVSKAIKELKTNNKIEWRCAYKIVK